MLLVFVNIRRKLLAILYRLCYTVPVGCGRGGFFAVLRGRGGFLLLVGSCEAGARKEPLSVERTAKRAARRAPFARHARLFTKNALRFSGGCAILKQPYKLNTTHRCGIGISYLFFL